MDNLLSRFLEKIKIPLPVLLVLLVDYFSLWFIREYNNWNNYILFHSYIFWCIAIVSIIFCFIILLINYKKNIEYSKKYPKLEQNIPIEKIHSSSISSGNVKYNTETKIDLQVRGVISDENHANFSIVSSGNGIFLIDRLYIKLHGFAKCNLRNERLKPTGLFEPSSYWFYISENYSIYDIVPLRPSGSLKKWIYKNEDFDDFLIDFSCCPYMLFIISFELEARDLRNNKEIKKSSDYYKLIWVKRGSFNGCLNIRKWYKPEMLCLPIQDRYKGNIPTFEYQLLTVNLQKDSSYLQEIGKEKLKNIMPRLEKITESRKEFTGRYQEIKKFINS